jgi:hypothetical protein
VRSLLARARCDSGQAFVFVAVALMVLVGMAALVIDGGSWYRAQRHLQTAADAAALAGAQELPNETSAEDVAWRYGTMRNGAGLGPVSLTRDARFDTIDVSATATAPGIFTRVFGSVFDEVDISAHAQARVTAPVEMKNVAPIAVKDEAACIVSHPECFGPENHVKVQFDESNIASSLIGLIDLTCHSDFSGGCDDPESDSNAPDDCNHGNGTGGSKLACWIEKGYPEALPSDQWYGVKTGETRGPIEAALEYAAAKRMRLLLPVFDKSCPGDPSCADRDRSFHIIGWAAFVIDPEDPENSDETDGVVWTPHIKQLTGYFVTFIATDLASGGTLPAPDSDYGVHVITLTH